MKIYSITFRKYDDYSKKSVSKIKDGRTERVSVPTGGDLLVPEIDLMKYSSYGDGYDKVSFIGELDDLYFMGKNSESAKKTIGVSIDKILGSSS